MADKERGYTSGPREWTGERLIGSDLYSDGCHEDVIGFEPFEGHNFGYGPHIRSNKALISAAPELLEALEWMVANDETNEGDEWEEINRFWIDGLNRARAAIAKAKGQSHA